METDNIRDTLFGSCIGATIVDITADDTEEFLADPKENNRVYFHLSNGETIWCCIAVDDDPPTLGMLGTEDDEDG